MSALLPTLDRFFRDVAPLEAGERLIVAFSGGPDSTSLLSALVPWSAERGIAVLAVHLDHGCDDDSAARARQAAGLAAELGAPFRAERREVDDCRRRRESPEAALRRIRYEYLDEVATEWGARWVATAHTRDDQVETVALRLLAGTGLDGLAAIAPRRGRWVRPLLTLDRGAVLAALPPGIRPVRDPGNSDLSVPRVWLRRVVLPHLERREPGSTMALASLAARARGAREVLDRRLLAGFEVEAGPRSVAFSRNGFAALGQDLGTAALAGLARQAGLDHPLGREARGELWRQLATARVRHESPSSAGRGRIGIDAAAGLRIEALDEGRLRFSIRDESGERATAPFSYTLPLPGAVQVTEIRATLRSSWAPIADWMFRGEPARAALGLPAGAQVTVRNRRPGDRLRPLGAPGERKLKDVLIDHRVPREGRDRLPLVVVDGRIAWVPGVTIDEAFRVSTSHSSAWVVEVIEP